MTVSEDARDVVNKMTASLPSQFLALLVINTIFILGMLWFLRETTVPRTVAFERILTACVSALDHPAR